MRLLDRYLLRELFVPLGFCLGAFVIFWVAFDLFGRLDDFHDRHYTVLDAGLYYLYELPKLLNTILPVVLLLGLLYTLSQHARHNEFIAMRAAGLSLWRICLPYFVIGLLFSGALFAINERVLTDADERQAALPRRPTVAGAESARWRPRINFLNPTGQRYWSLGAFNLDTAALRQLRVTLALPAGAYREVTADSARWTNGYWKLTNGIERLFRAQDDALPAEKAKPIFTVAEMDGPPGAVALWDATPLTVSNAVVALTNLTHADEPTRRRWSAASLTLTNDLIEGLRFQEPLAAGARRVLIADGGVWTNGHWRFLNAREFLYRSTTEGDVLENFYPELDLPEFDESPDMIRSEVRISELLSRNSVMRRAELPVRDVLDYLYLHPNLSGADTARLKTQLHARIAAPWTCLVVVFIAIPFGSGSGRRNIFYGVAGSLALGFLFFTVQRLGFALGQSGLVPGWVGAWLPNVSFATAGIWLITRVR